MATTLDEVLTSDQKGAIAETAIVHAATKLGIDVYRPVAEGGRYDYIFDLPRALTRVQCKWASRDGNVLIVRCYSCRRAREGMRKRPYTPDEIDAIAAYSIELDRCYFLSLDEIYRQASILLRLAPTENNQRLKINWASDYEFEARLGRPQGAVAQLGERLTGSQKGTGSSPVGSTLFD
jgi:PD-(D/E)XK endonuclease